jgi:protein TonB
LSLSLAASSTPEDLVLSRKATFVSATASPDASAAALFSSWPAPLEESSLKSRELGGVLVLSLIFHVVFATAALRGGHDAHHTKRLSRVEIELARPIEPPKPVLAPVVPPIAPKVVKQEFAAPRPKAAETPAPPPPEPSKDTGSSSPAAEDGELYAGHGGTGVAPPPAPVVAAAPAVVAAPVVQAREGANYLKNPRPAYPRHAKREGWEGTTVLRVQVQASGKPAAIKVFKSSGHDVLDEAAAESVANWTFAPATQGGAPVAGSVLVPIVFRLQ